MIGPMIKLGFSLAYAAGAVYLIKKQYCQSEDKHKKKGRQRR